MSEQWPTLGPELIKAMLRRAGDPKHVFLAFSGGIDSHVLLHLCQAIPEIRGRLTAVHVHHGLQKVADLWPAHCKKTAEQLGVDFRELRVDGRAEGRESPEEAARNARYTALSAMLDRNDVLLVAQHREDQLETMLLQLFRGAGLSGLSAMPEVMALGKGILLRPLLHVSKQAIDEYARSHRLEWVEDPSNRSDEYDRNFLRNQVLPLLKQRWPALDKTVSRSAGHCAEARRFIGQAAEDLLVRVMKPSDNTLKISELRLLDRYRQQLVIRQWFARSGLKMPSQGFVRRVMSEVVEAAESKDPVLNNQGYTIRRYRNHLFCVAQSAAEPVATDISWRQGEVDLQLPDGSHLRCVASGTGIDALLWRESEITVRFRSGGEKIGVPGRKGRHSLKKLYQEAGIPPWERPTIPLIYMDNQLAAVAGLWVSDRFFKAKNGPCIQLVWSKQK
ncbi:MAG: tRNA lysidine(34) synthetase TilS [Gammaproteobacteria bacterium]